MGKDAKAFGKVHLPPDLVLTKGKEVIHVCVSSDPADADYLELTIADPGYCLHAPSGSFTPDLPSGPVIKQPPVKMYPTIKSGTAYLAYSDSKSGKTFVFVIAIKKNKCKSDDGS